MLPQLPQALETPGIITAVPKVKVKAILLRFIKDLLFWNA